MRYTTSARGLLTRRYRSVLKKCFLINMGLFAIGVMTATPANADQTYATLAEAIADSTTADKTYTLEADENVTADLGDLQGSSLTIDGNNGQYSINGNEHQGLSVGYGKNLTIQNVGDAEIVRDSDGNITDIIVNKAIRDFTKSNGGATIFAKTESNLSILGNNVFANNSTTGLGSSIYLDYSGSNTGSLNISGSNLFIGNHSESNIGYIPASGGAIKDAYGIKTFTILGSNTFINNYTSGTGSASAQAGAIYYGQYSSSTAVTGANSFIGNYATSDSGSARGGAIYTRGNLNITADKGTSIFKDNYATSDSGTAQGGAIWTDKDVTIIADNGTSIFKGNYIQVGDSEKDYQAIWMNKKKSTLTFDTKNNGQIYMYDNVNGNYGATNNTQSYPPFYYIDDNGEFILDSNGNKIPEGTEDSLSDEDKAKLTWGGYTVNITGDGTGTMHLYNDIKNADVNVSNTTLDIGTATVNISKNLAFASDSVLAMTINGFADGEHGLLNVSDSLTVENGAKLKATLAQELVADTAKGEENRVTLIKVADSANWDNSNGDFTAEHELDDGENIVADSNNMYEFKQSDDEAGTYIVTKLKTAAEIADDEASGNEDSEGSSTAAPSTWVGEAAGAWVDNGGYTEGTVAADVANQLANLAQNDAAALVQEIKALAPTETAVVQETATEDASRVFKNVSAYLRGERDPMGFASGDALEDVSIWGKAYIGESKISRRGNIAGSEADSKGVILGIEKKLSNTVKVGAGMQYDTTDIDAYRRNIEADSVHGFVYGEYKPNRWFVNGVVAYGESDYDERKYALGTHFDAKYDADITSVAAMTGYQFKYFTPEVGMRYYHIKQNGYTDTAGQSVEGDKSDILRGVAGVRVAKDFGKFRPEAHLGITYDLASDKGNTTVNLANGSSYTVPGKRLDKLGYESSLGLALTLSDNLTASISYLGAYRENYREHTGMFNVKYNF